ncbi:acid protease [Mycena epipterygia]|nr:acid protease [Mycena epipterygia]
MGSDYDYEYLANITIGGQGFSVIVDTGSSDTWLAEKGFACFNLTGHPEPVSTCAFGTQGFDIHQSKSFQPYPNTSFSISYGDGEYLSGAAAFETVSVGGLTVTHQEIGVVSSAAWIGDGINSGLLGLAYPSLTSVHGQYGQKLQYNPFFFNAVKQNQIPHPYFSLALNRGTYTGEHSANIDPHLGYLAFGGIAPVPVTSTAVTIPIQGYSAETHAPASGANATFFYYAVPVQHYIYNSANNTNATIFTPSASSSTIVDSGTTLNLLPSPVAQAYNVHADWRGGLYYVNCTVRAPPFGVVLGGKTFSIDPRDLVVPVGTDANGTALCASGIQDGGREGVGSVFVLGDVFLHNVVTTFDIQKNQLTVTQRQNY